MNKIKIEEVKARVPLGEALSFYGFRLKRGRMPCPFHNGNDDNFSVKRNHYHCFVCNESGDVITFAQKYFGLSFIDALKKLNDDFHLGLKFGDNGAPSTITDEQIEKPDSMKKVEERRTRLDALQKRYNEAFEAFAACDILITRCRPVSAVAGVSEAFAWALKNIDRCWYELKEAEVALFEFEMDEE